MTRLHLRSNMEETAVEVIRRAGSDTWTYNGYTNLGQPYFAEVVVFLCITTMAVLFEVGHHWMHHHLASDVRPVDVCSLALSKLILLLLFLTPPFTVLSRNTNSTYSLATASQGTYRLQWPSITWSEAKNTL